MNRRHSIRALADLKTICSVQRMDLDMQVRRADAQLRALDTKRDHEGEALQAHQQDWRGAVSGRSFDLAAAAFWSAEILRSEAVIKQITIDIRAATDWRRQLCAARSEAEARCDVLDDLLRSTRRADQSRRDEAALEAGMGYSSSGWRLACA